MTVSNLFPLLNNGQLFALRQMLNENGIANYQGGTSGKGHLVYQSAAEEITDELISRGSIVKVGNQYIQAHEILERD
jgi:hypothetical protein